MAPGEEAHRRGSNMIVSQHSVSGVAWPAGGEVQKRLYVAKNAITRRNFGRYLSLRLRP